MAKLIDPDQLNQGTEVVINTTAKTIQLLVAGNLSNDPPAATSGVSLQAVYSFLKEEWKADAALNKFRFPLTAIYEAKFVLINGWSWADATTRGLIRDAGWQETDGAEYAMIISLGTMNDDLADQAYYQQVVGFDQLTVDFPLTGALNSPILIYDGGSNDYRDYLKAFLREQGKTFDQYDLLAEQNLSAITYIAYRLPLSNAIDIKIDAAYTDASIGSAMQPFNSMKINYLAGTRFEIWDTGESYVAGDVVKDPSTGTSARWYRALQANSASQPTVGADWEIYPGEHLIGSTYYAFNRIIEASVNFLPDAEQIYAFAQYKLRQTTNINDASISEGTGVINGNVANPLCYFVGDNLWSEPGVWFQNFDPNITNSVTLQAISAALPGTGGLDDEGLPKVFTAQTFPFVAAGNIIFNNILYGDTDAEYWVYFADAGGNQYDTANAIIVWDNDDASLMGDIPVDGIVPFTFDYDNNVQGGRTAGTDAAVYIVAMGLNEAEWISSPFTITRATGLTFPVNANIERNYLNPA